MNGEMKLGILSLLGNFVIRMLLHGNFATMKFSYLETLFFGTLKFELFYLRNSLPCDFSYLGTFVFGNYGI
jgi:hypothetical protein